MIFETIREYLNNDFERYISEWFPNVIRVSNTIWKTGDFNDTKTKKGDGSLVFNIRENYTKDFSTGETAGDIISIYAHRFCNGSQKKALKELVERYNLQSMVEPYYIKKNKRETNLVVNGNNNSNSSNNNITDVIEYSNGNNNTEYNNNNIVHNNNIKFYTNKIIDYNTIAIPTDNNIR